MTQTLQSSKFYRRRRAQSNHVSMATPTRIMFYEGHFWGLGFLVMSCTIVDPFFIISVVSRFVLFCDIHVLYMENYVDFMDWLIYVPLFVEIHTRIISNPFLRYEDPLKPPKEPEK